MRDLRLRSLFSAFVLMSSGILLLLFEFDLLTPYTPLLQYILAGLCVFGAILFFGAFARAPAEWWRLIPGWTLLALALIFLLITFAVDQRWLGATVFGGLALAFTHVYLTNRNERWWALIPGGFLLVLGAVIGLSAWVTRIEWLALLLFGGLGLVFFLLFLLHRRQWWAVLPGGVLLVFAALAAVRGDDGQAAPLLRWWPLILIAAGLVTALRSRRPAKAERMQVHNAPARKPARATPQSAPINPALGDYTQPAPGATIEVLPDPDE